jgi:hypothetical protein
MCFLYEWALCLTLGPLLVCPQDGKSEAKSEPDVLIFTDGEKLIGHLVRSTGGEVTFKSDMAGEVSVEWTNVQELRSSQKFAVVQKDVQLHRGEADGKARHGTIAVKGQRSR